MAARKIETAWLGMRDRQLFKLLKHAVCAAVSHLPSICFPYTHHTLVDLSVKIMFSFAFKLSTVGTYN